MCLSILLLPLQVVRALSMSDSGDLSNGLRVGESQLYDSAQQSAEIRWFRRMAFGSQDASSDFFSSPSHQPGFSGQSRQNAAAPLSTQQDPSRFSQNTGFRNQSGNNLNFSAERRGTQLNPPFSTQHIPNRSFQNMGFRTQSGNNLNTAVDRHFNQQNPGTWDSRFQRDDSGNR